ncbi:M23 family metallopeptidase [Tepidibacillus fermentans]|uniref:Stage II sporulation protein Q n=1 Tax=Tepidibacillus fermentans TaxID=1281767 RepID=A0A4R3KJD8_9BACI|nr:M23 family metallopeptidase [Tepidibacillus fermentans]TCS83385.1 stage II sporulation protein Q [Tepidibacillus fermentans]
MSPISKWKKLLGKKWTFPAIYMTVAALILTLMWWYQNGHNPSLTKEDLGIQQTTNETANADLVNKDQAVPVTAHQEQMIWPVQDPSKADIKMEFFDSSLSDKEMEKAIVRFQDEIWPHTGIDIVSKDKSPLTVIAALSGEVVRAEKDPVVGFMVDIRHENGLVTNYSSLSELKVAKGDKVTQGQVLGTAGRNIFEKDQGVHLHFEVRKGDEALSPQAFIGQDASQVLKQLEQKANATKDTNDQDKKTDSKTNEQPKTNEQKSPTSFKGNLS